MLSGCTQQLESISGSLTRLSNNLNQIAGTSSSPSNGKLYTDEECKMFLKRYEDAGYSGVDGMVVANCRIQLNSKAIDLDELLKAQGLE